MSNPRDFYKNRVILFEAELKKTKQSLYISSVLRLLVFVTTLIAAYYFFGTTNLFWSVLLGGIVLFLLLVLRHVKLVYQKKKAIALIEINRTELNVLDRNFDQLYDGAPFEDSSHYYSSDIDLFGSGSFYQYLNRSELPEGQIALSKLLTENNILDIPEKQSIIQELGAIPVWRQDFSAVAKIIKKDMSTVDLQKWMHNYSLFLPKTMRFIPLVFSILSGIVILLYATDVIPGFFLFAWFLLGLGISGRYVQKINKLSQASSKVQDTLQQYQKLLGLIEEKKFESELLEKKRNNLVNEVSNASVLLHKFYRFLSALDQRNNLLVGIFLNGFMLWDLKQVYSIETWITENRDNLTLWIETLVYFDAYNSLGNFAFNHNSFVYPKLTRENTVIKATNLGHPMLDPKDSIANDFSINLEQFYIITGANMAGKSTFLRTISLFIVMSNIGLPVCASTACYRPIKLITSMRSVDSLSANESYFYAELKRLKFITEEIEKDQYFVILDEILKGTNSKDKAAGSEKFIQKLVNSKTVGLTATHDLSLCKMADTDPRIKNYFFDAQIEKDELFFDYRFQEGVCSNMNASFLLRKMNIVD